MGSASTSFCKMERARSNDAQRLGWMAGPILDGSDDLVALSQVGLEPGDGRVCVGQMLQDGRACWKETRASAKLSGFLFHVADVVVALGQVALELGGFGVGRGEL